MKSKKKKRKEKRTEWKWNSCAFNLRFLSRSQADRSRTLGVAARSVFQWTSDREGAPKAVRADEPDAAPEETLPQRTRFGRNAPGVGAPQPFGVSVPVQERTLELQFGWPGEPSEKRSVNVPICALLSVQVPGCPLWSFGLSRLQILK